MRNPWILRKNSANPDANPEWTNAEQKIPESPQPKSRFNLQSNPVFPRGGMLPTARQISNAVSPPHQETRKLCTLTRMTSIKQLCDITALKVSGFVGLVSVYVE
jgi:hypothetical protein